jgi:hypothetical protein
MVGDITLSFVDYSLSKSVHLTLDIVEYEAGVGAALIKKIKKNGPKLKFEVGNL